jgi:hypothetical protein
MTKENFTSINVIMDASGSMQGLTTDTIGSFNTFLKEQKAVPGEAVFTLCRFNTDYSLLHDFVKLGGVPDLDTKSYCPSGGTALLDAMGATIESVGTKLAALDESERPSKVIFLIITDGHENSSHRFSAAKIKEMVDHQKEKYSWEFVFMGANIDAITAAANLGVDTRNSMNYVPSAAGTAQLYSTVSESMTNYRSSGNSASRGDFFAGSQNVNPTNQTITPSSQTIATPVIIMPTGNTTPQKP